MSKVSILAFFAAAIPWIAFAIAKNNPRAAPTEHQGVDGGTPVWTASASPSDLEEVESVARDYIEGWYTGDVARMNRALHDDLVKRMPFPGDSLEPTQLRPVSKSLMLELTAGGGGENPGAVVEIVIDDVSRDIATARVASPDYLDYLHLAKTSNGWKIVNVLFHPRE